MIFIMKNIEIRHNKESVRSAFFSMTQTDFYFAKKIFNKKYPAGSAIYINIYKPNKIKK